MHPFLLLVGLIVPEPMPTEHWELAVTTSTVVVTGELHYRSKCDSGEDNPATTRPNSLGGPFVYFSDDNGTFIGDPVPVVMGRFEGPAIDHPGTYFVNVIFEDRPWFISQRGKADMVAFEVSNMLEDSVMLPPLCIDADGPVAVSYFKTEPADEPDIIVGLVTGETARAGLSSEPEMVPVPLNVGDPLFDSGGDSLFS